MANNQCKECGCQCRSCTVNDHDVHLHVEIENLKQHLAERDSHIVTMETNFLNEANKFPNGEMVALQEELATWQDKYRRLYEAHRRVQRVNQGLEDKLLKLVDTNESDKTALTQDVATLSHKLAEANYTIKKLTEDNERYKNDVSLAIQFLQCKPANFVSHKFESLPNELQAKVLTLMTSKRKSEERKSIKVPISTFPPTAMVYSVPKSPKDNRKSSREACNAADTTPVDIVSAAIMAKVLEERERERTCLKHCDTCVCSRNLKIIHNATQHFSVSTQTSTSGKYENSLCLSCNVNLDNSISNVRLVRNNVDKSKNTPLVHDYDSVNQNIAKVQPNNFLIDSTGAINNNLEVVPLNNPEILPKYFQVNEKSSKIDAKQSETMDAYKGGRACSMRLQNGSKNILLDSTPNNVSPVLYTKSSDRNAQTKELSASVSTPNSISSEECKTASTSSENNVGCNQQRVVDWVENSLETESTSDYSESLNSLKSDDRVELDQKRYREMEDNVKRFLFGELHLNALDES